MQLLGAYTLSDGISVLNQKCVRGHKINFDLARVHDIKAKKISHEKIIQVGDVLVNSTGTGTLGRVAQVKELPFEATVDSHITIVRPIKNIFDAKYFGYAMIFIEEEIAKRGDGCGGQTELARNTLKNDFIVTYPESITEQKHIVFVLEKFFAAIATAKDNTAQNLKNAKELFESYLQGVFDAKKENWEKKILGEVCELISKGSSPKWQGINYTDEPGVLFVTSENVGENTLLLNERKYVEEKFNIKEKKSILKKGDVLTNIVGGSIGRTAIYDLDYVANINQAVCLIRSNQHLLFNEYLMYLLNSPFTKQHLHDNEVNNARANLSLGFFRTLSIPLPDLSVQKSIVNHIKLFHSETQKLENIYQSKLNELEELKKSVLQKAFSGELITNAEVVA